jgi:hypothetical protein
MPLPHFLQIGGGAFTVLTVPPNLTGVSPEISNAGAAADMTKPRHLGIPTYSNWSRGRTLDAVTIDTIIAAAPERARRADWAGVVGDARAGFTEVVCEQRHFR